MNRTSALAGIVGLVLLFFALVDYFTASGFRILFWINLIAGAFSIVLWLTSGRSAIGAIAGGRAARYGTNAAIYTLAFVGLLAALNYILTLHRHRFDLTAEKIFSLSSQSDKVLDQLDKPLKFYGFVKGGVNPNARRLYEMYAYESPKVSYELVDPDVHPELATRFKVSEANTTHIQYGGPKGQGTNVTDLSEQALTNAIIKLESSHRETVYFLEGHGEADPADYSSGKGFGQIRKAIEGENYEFKKLVLASEPAVPADCAVLIIAGPVRPLLPHEVDAVRAYLQGGGRLLLMLRPPRPDKGIDESALINLAGDYGIKAQDDVVVDQVVRLFAGPALGLEPIVNTYGDSPIANNFTQRTVFPMTRSLLLDSSEPGRKLIPLAQTSNTSWAETDLEDLFLHQTAQLGPNDHKGPVIVAATATQNIKQAGGNDQQARLVVFGDTEFANNQHIDDFYNRDFFMNAIDWLGGQSKSISIRPRTLRASRVMLTVDQFSIVFALSVLLLPELLMIVGIAVWWGRRN